MNKVSALPRSLLASALILLLGIDSMPLRAQQTSGTAYGQAEPGVVVVIESKDSGLRRTATADQSGNYRFSSLPPGRYAVYVQNNRDAQRSIEVTPSIAAEANFATKAGNAAELAAVSVRGNTLPSIDVTSSESVTTFSAAQLKTLPLPHDIGLIALLAPGAVRTDSALTSDGGQFIPSFGGASAAENSYYVNGFNVTNQYDTLGFSQVPFRAIGSMDVKTGGYGAQYGYSTGGVISVNTLRGTNEWIAGGAVDWQPPGTEKGMPLIYQRNGPILRNNNAQRPSDTTVSAWAGGPIVKDTLFFYVNLQQERSYSTSYPTVFPLISGAPTGATQQAQRNPFWIAKLDWHISDSHILEYTGFNDTQHQRVATSAAVYAADNRSVALGDHIGTEWFQYGGQLNVLKYTGYLSDALTLNAQYGEMSYNRKRTALAANGTLETYNGVVGDFNQPGCPPVTDNRASVVAGTDSPYPSCSFASPLGYAKGQDTKKQGNLDLEWKWGTHDFKVGYADTKFKTINGRSDEGGVDYTYQTDPNLGDYVSVGHVQSGAKVGIDQTAWYLEDSWNPTKNLLVYLGLRNDAFKNTNGAGQAYVKQSDIWQPRLGFSWDVNGDAAFKVFGSAGRYSLPMDTTVALRGISASLNSTQDFFYTGVNPSTGAPLNLRRGDGLPNPDILYVNGEAGVTPDPRSNADKDLKPYEQNEFILGLQHQFADSWTFGVKGTHRELVNAIDDSCDWRPIQKWGLAHGIDVGSYPPATTPGCYLFNPGHGVKLNIDLTGSGTLTPVALTAADIGEPKAKRTYDALELSLSHVWDERYLLNLTYVWSKLKGNYEGLVDSDNGQTLTGNTQAFDYPEVMQNTNGYLPNDRRHTLTATGFVKATEEWTFGSTFQLVSGRPENCFGIYPDKVARDYISYGNSFFYCQGQAVPRGTAGRTPWTWTLGLSAAYKPHWMPGLTLTVDAQNVFNNTKPLGVYEYGESSTGISYASTLYKIPTQFQTPFRMMFSAQYDFDFSH